MHGKGNGNTTAKYNCWAEHQEYGMVTAKTLEMIFLDDT